MSSDHKLATKLTANLARVEPVAPSGIRVSLMRPTVNEDVPVASGFTR